MAHDVLHDRGVDRAEACEVVEGTVPVEVPRRRDEREPIGVERAAEIGHDRLVDQHVVGAAQVDHRRAVGGDRERHDRRCPGATGERRDIDRLAVARGGEVDDELGPDDPVGAGRCVEHPPGDREADGAVRDGDAAGARHRGGEGDVRAHRCPGRTGVRERRRLPHTRDDDGESDRHRVHTAGGHDHGERAGIEVHRGGGRPSRQRQGRAAVARVESRCDRRAVRHGHHGTDRRCDVGNREGDHRDGPR